MCCGPEHEATQTLHPPRALSTAPVAFQAMERARSAHANGYRVLLRLSMPAASRGLPVVRFIQAQPSLHEDDAQLLSL